MQNDNIKLSPNFSKTFPQVTAELSYRILALYYLI